jgi:hypothetical protein
VALFNRGESVMPVRAFFRDIGVGESASVRDLWAKRDLGMVRDHFTATVAKHGVVLLKVK